MATLVQLEKRIARLEKAIGAGKVETWVKASHIMRLTGWDRHAMQRARETGLVKYKLSHKGKNGYFYLLESVNEKFHVGQTTCMHCEARFRSI